MDHACYGHTSIHLTKTSRPTLTRGWFSGHTHKLLQTIASAKATEELSVIYSMIPSSQQTPSHKKVFCFPPSLDKYANSWLGIESNAPIENAKFWGNKYHIYFHPQTWSSIMHYELNLQKLRILEPFKLGMKKWTTQTEKWSESCLMDKNLVRLFHWQ